MKISCIHRIFLGIDFSGVETVTGPPNADGAQISFANDRYRFWSAVSNDALGGRGPFPRETSRLTISTRQELQLAGHNWNNWNDTVGRKDRPFGILMGGASTYSLSSENINFGNTRNSGLLTLDFSLSGVGFQALTYTTVKWAIVNGAFEYFYGFDAQTGYFINKVWQVYTEYELVSPGNRSEDLSRYNALRIGTNVFPYLWTNRYRFAVEGGILFNPFSETLVPENPASGWLAANTGKQYEIRTQLTFGF